MKPGRLNVRAAPVALDRLETLYEEWREKLSMYEDPESDEWADLHAGVEKALKKGQKVAKTGAFDAATAQDLYEALLSLYRHWRQYVDTPDDFFEFNVTVEKALVDVAGRTPELEEIVRPEILRKRW